MSLDHDGAHLKFLCLTFQSIWCAHTHTHQLRSKSDKHVISSGLTNGRRVGRRNDHAVECEHNATRSRTRIIGFQCGGRAWFENAAGTRTRRLAVVWSSRSVVSCVCVCSILIGCFNLYANCADGYNFWKMKTRAISGNIGGAVSLQFVSHKTKCHLNWNRIQRRHSS